MSKHMTKEEYRTKHQKCKWCSFCKLNVPKQIGLDIGSYYTCTVKDKLIRSKELRNFCRCFDLNTNYKCSSEIEIKCPLPPIKINKDN